MPIYPRLRSDKDYRSRVPVHAVWEITLACNLKCLHCGSRAGRPRTNELSTEQCLGVVEQLALLGTREVTLIGGEAYLRSDWTDIVRAVRTHGMYCAIQTGGYQLSDKRLAEAVEAGLQGVGVSLDGLRPLHDRVRGVHGSFDRAIDLLRRCKSCGLNTSVNTQIGPETIADLAELMEVICSVGASQWQVQLTVAMGNAVDNDHLLLQPYQLLELMPLLARLYQGSSDRGTLLVVGNNIGYFGPYEHLWRGFGDERIHWTGCSGGGTVIALEADGTVKGCPSLATTRYGGGNVLDLTLEQIWKNSDKVRSPSQRTSERLWGFCGTCYYAEVCRGGCTWTADSLLGVPGNNPYCHYRAITLEKKGLRERVRKRLEAAPTPFAVGEFEVITENLAGDVVSTVAKANLISLDELVQVKGRAGISQVPPSLSLCRGCNCYVSPSEIVCPHCGSDIRQEDKKHAKAKRHRERVKSEVLHLLDQLIDH